MPHKVKEVRTFKSIFTWSDNSVWHGSSIVAVVSSVRICWKSKKKMRPKMGITLKATSLHFRIVSFGCSHHFLLCGM